MAEAFGYSPEELTSIPAEANMGLSAVTPRPLPASSRVKLWWIWDAEADWTCSSPRRKLVPLAGRLEST